MSLYRQAIQAAMPEARARVGLPSSGNRVLPLVKVSHVIPTPHGPVIAGEIVVGEYFAPGERVSEVSGEPMPDNAYVIGDLASIDDLGNEIGWSLGGAFKSVGKGLVKGVKVATKVATAPVRLQYKIAKGAGKLALRAGKGITKASVRVVKKTGKVVLKGSKAAVKFAKKNPVKALALAAVAPAALGIYATYKAAKFVGKNAGKALGGGGQQALPPMEEEQPQAEAIPESYPGEQEATTDTEAETPDVLEAPDTEPSPDSEEETGEAEENGDDSEEGSETDTGEDENSVQGVSKMEDQWVGLDEIAGEEIAGDDDYVGASPKRRTGPPGPNSAKVRQTGYTKFRRQYLPIASGSIAAGASATITIAPQTLFRGRRLSIPASLAPNFLIDDLKVGNVSQGAAAGSVPAESFVANATGEDNIQMDTASPGKTISMNVTNTSGGALTFRAALFGDSVQ